MKTVLFLLALLTTGGLAQAGEIDGRSNGRLLRKPFVSENTGVERDYFLYLPKGYENETSRLWPVILFLHGGGERGDGKKDLDVLLKHGPLKEAWVNSRDLPFIMISPQMPAMDAGAQRRRAEERRQRRRAAPQQSRGPIVMAREPSGVAPRWSATGPPRGWNENSRDVLNMVDQTLKEYRADPQRVYVTGLSYCHVTSLLSDRGVVVLSEPSRS